jgi:hypothetical protein
MAVACEGMREGISKVMATGMLENGYLSAPPGHGIRDKRTVHSSSMTQFSYKRPGTREQ